MIIDCPNCKIPMRNITALMMGPDFKCEQCELKIWKRFNTLLKVIGTSRDPEGNSQLKMGKI